MTKIAVYGTLKKGGYFHRAIEHCPYIGTVKVPGFVMYNLGTFPGIVPGDGTITAEIYDASEEEIAEMDRIEGHPHMYKRTWMDEGYWIYVYQETYLNVPIGKIVESGDWPVEVK